MRFGKERKRLGVIFISLALLCSLLSGCVTSSGSVTFNMPGQGLSQGEQLYLRFADGTTATSDNQSGQAQIVIQNPQQKQIVGAFIYDEADKVSFVGEYAINNGIVNVSSMSGVEGKPGFAATSVAMGGLVPAVDNAGYYSVALTVYGDSGGKPEPVEGRTEVFMEASGAEFKDISDVAKSDSPADGGFSTYTKAGQATFLIKPKAGVNLQDLKFRVWSGPKLLYSDDRADLAALKLSGAGFEPFQPDVDLYTTNVPYSMTSLSVTATVYDEDASLTVGGAPAQSGVASAVPLVPGLNVIPIVVALPDQTSKIYTVKVLRQSELKGSGTEGDPYLITTPDRLAQIKDYLDSADVYFKLAADIDMSGYADALTGGGWEPIGSEKKPFEGHLDGGGYALSNLSFDIDGVGGLFGYVGENAHIQDLRLIDVDARSTQSVGALAAVNLGTISDSMASGSVSAPSNSEYSIGGLVGENKSGAVVKRSAFSGRVEGDYSIGGLVGSNKGAIEQSFANAEIDGIGTIGGLTAYNIGGTVLNSYAMGSLKGNQSGGIAAVNDNGRIENSYAATKITSYDAGEITDNNAGGIAWSANEDDIVNSFYDAQVASELNLWDAAYGLDTVEMKSSNTYLNAGWNMSEIWTIDPDINAGYPTLRPATWHVTYEGNGQDEGDAPLDLQAYALGNTAIAAENVGGLAKAGYRFTGWNTAADGSGTHFAPGAQVKAGTSGIKLYAEWALAQAPELRSATAGDASVALEWSAVELATGYEIYRGTASGQYGEPISVGGTVYGYEDKGLTNGTTYYYVVKVTSAAGNSELSNELSAVPSPTQGGENPGNNPGENPGNNPGENPGNNPGENPGNNPGENPGNNPGENPGNNPGDTPVNPPPVTGNTDQKTELELRVNDKVVRGITAVSTEAGGRKVTTVSVSEEGVKALLAASEQGDVITIPVTGSADVVIQQVSGALLAGLREKQLTLKLESPVASYSLPVQHIDLDGLSKRLGASEAKDLRLEIVMASASSIAASGAADAAAQGGFSIIGTPVEFTVRGLFGEKSATVDVFDAYVERTLTLPDSVDPNKITTGVVIDPDGTVRHVPTKIVLLAGKYYAKINSLTNSTYAMVGHALTFADVEGHWAKDAVNDMGSRLIVKGVNDTTFNPDADITRAEFAAIVVRGLGLKLGEGDSSYRDVPAGAWYESAIRTAAAYGLINGFEDGTFRPNDEITREQGMAIVAKAMGLTGLSASGGAADTLQPFADADAVSAWAKDAIANTLQAGLVSGRSASQLAPQASMTRAEVAQLVRKLLSQAGLI